LRDIAARTWTLCPRERGTRPAAVYLPGQLERIEAVQENTSREAEMRRVNGGAVEHIATTMFELRDASLAGGSVWASGARFLMLGNSLVRAGLAGLAAPEERLDSAALDCTFVGNRYFGHWLTDDCTLHLIAREHAPPVGVARPPYPQEAGYAAAWGLSFRKVGSARVKSLLICEDHGQNASKRERYHKLRAALRSHSSDSQPVGVYLRRGTSGVLRLLVNEDEVETALTRRGFAVVDPHTASASDLIRACAGAACVVTVEGSAMAHGAMTVRDRGSLVCLQPPWRFNAVFKDYTDCLDLRYGFVIGARSGDGFAIDVGELERTLDLCAR
jgi:hypothetical protein